MASMQRVEEIEKEEYERFDVPFQRLGFWVFLSGEIIILGGLVAAGILFRLSYPGWFESSTYTNVVISSINTFVLLTGSLTAVLAHKYAVDGNWGKVQLFLGLTALAGLTFVGLKFIEYSKEIALGFVPSKNVFWMFYYGLTGLHGAHVLAGTLIIIGVMLYIRKKKLVEAVENAGLYWHFVDIVWLYIFPLFYLT
ncbi:MAG: heme-copper oxidase subunit III [Candidatus Calescibacterium sp.]|nr:heme-copper oxidase subunit III [Candidatus Calescibacterium sp.]MCX7733842.1 heme-copper oxidase subunit III [bacterium]